MKTSELTDRSLLVWILNDMRIRLAAHNNLAADERHWPAHDDDYRRGQSEALRRHRGEAAGDIARWRNSISLGIRIIDGELTGMGERPWSETDADHDGSERTPVVDYVKLPNELLEACIAAHTRLRAIAREEKEENAWTRDVLAAMEKAIGNATAEDLFAVR